MPNAWAGTGACGWFLKAGVSGLSDKVDGAAPDIIAAMDVSDRDGSGTGPCAAA